MLRGAIGNHLNRRHRGWAQNTSRALNAVRANVVVDNGQIELSEGKSTRGFRFLRAEGVTSEKPWTIDIYPNSYFRVKITGLEAQTFSGISSLVWFLRGQLARV